jgi:hypothetical protein
MDHETNAAAKTTHATVERLQVGAALGLLIAGLLACKGGKSDDTAEPPTTAASATTASTPATATATVPTATATSDTTATAKVTVNKPATETPPAPVVTGDYVPHPDENKKCPTGFVGIPNRCARMCKTAKDCQSGHKCEILPPELGDGQYCADGTW